MSSTKCLAFICLFAGIVTLLFFLVKIDPSSDLNFTTAKGDYFTVSGQVGDFIGGVVGTFFALTGTILIYLTFQEQVKENKRSAFEASFFEMIRIHRENVRELRYEKYKNGSITAYENRQVFRVIFDEFIECYREVGRYSNSSDVNDYVTQKYQAKLRRMIANINPSISIIEMAKIDIAYSIVFYGLSEEGESFVKKNMQSKYNPKYYFKLLYFIKIKPKKSNSSRFHAWDKIKNLDLKILHPLIGELYANRKTPDKTEGLSPLAIELNMQSKYEKYYGGHQFRLGHYFRHLYQSYTYLHNHKDVKEVDKYAYGKMLRAQLSTYEQALLFVNSICSLGMNWEFMSKVSEEKNGQCLITKYNLIKNLPSTHISGIKYKTYYRDVDYESDEQRLLSHE